MKKLEITTLEEANEDGWVPVRLMVTDGEGDPPAEGHLIGEVRVVEGTEGKPVEWWDARVFDEHEKHERRFLAKETALLALATRQFDARVAMRAWGW